MDKVTDGQFAAAEQCESQGIAVVVARSDYAGCASASFTKFVGPALGRKDISVIFTYSRRQNTCLAFQLAFL